MQDVKHFQMNGGSSAEAFGTQYKQVGNAVPVNLAYEIGLEIHKSFRSFLYNSNIGFQEKEG